MPPSLEKPESSSQLLFDVICISIPLCINGFLTNIIGTLATLIVPRRLISAGFDYSEALSMIGKYNGMAMCIITIPMIVISTINTLIIPDLSQTLNQGKEYEASLRIRKVIKLAFLLGLATAIICNIVPVNLGQMFFGRDDLGNYIRFSSLSAPIIFTSLTMFGILNGLNRQSIILRNSLIEAVSELICLYIFTSIHSINIFGYSITMCIACSISFLLNIHEVKKHIDININGYNIIIYLLLAVLVFITVSIFSKYCSVYYPMINNFAVMVITFSIFAYLGGFGETE